MVCPKCGGNRVTVSTIQTETKSKTKNTGCLWELGRLCLIICTCGLWLLVGKRKEHSKTVYKTTTIAVCQDCGHRWEIE